jgi:8-amino-7-oxononanoate synthase
MNPQRASDAAPDRQASERRSNPSIGSWERLLAADLDDVRSINLYRSRQIVRPLDAVHVEIAGRRLVNFASNNYLGLTHHPEVIAASSRCAQSDGAGSGAAALISGYTPTHASAEQRLARWKGTESAVLLPSGYQANHAALQTIKAVTQNRGGVRFLVDKLCHASLIDAVRASGAPFRVYPHNHLGKLRRLLEAGEEGQVQVVVTESIFSMDGDQADLGGLAELREEFEFVWFLDEAHATGVYGPNGSGLASEKRVTERVDVMVVTLSKALGGVGGAVCASTRFCEALINHGRAFIFSTNVSPASAAAAEVAVDVIEREPERLVRLRFLAGRVRERLGMTGDSPIIPIILQSETATLAAASAMRAEGMLVAAVRPPTVPRGSSRLRITLCCEHTDLEVNELIAAVKQLIC